ncbi:MAG: cell division protein FtsZ [Prevotellaceae bacterium]|jgi:cell division protein FtsZ|nr:cell division protein FtsZ [Prevotellaceae bacterium]
MSAEDFLNDEAFEPLKYKNYEVKTSDNIIKVIGVGGGGGNAVGNLFEEKLEGISYCVCNTDRQALNRSPVPNQILIGENITFGEGAGNIPELARQAAEASKEEITEYFGDNKQTKMVFITAGMGGGTGTGAAPVVARICSELGILTIGIVTIPFLFEGKKKMRQAFEGIEKMAPYVDSLLIIQNEKITEKYPKAEVDEFFKLADKVLSDAVRGVVEIILKYGYMNVDFADVYTTLKNGRRTVMNSGYGAGENRIAKAIDDALQSPLLFDYNIKKTTKVLMAFYTSPTSKITADELNEITEFQDKNFANEVDFIWGLFYDDTLGEQVKVTILATGENEEILPKELRDLINNIAPVRIDVNPPKIICLSDFDDIKILEKYQNEPAYSREE